MGKIYVGLFFLALAVGFVLGMKSGVLEHHWFSTLATVLGGVLVAFFWLGLGSGNLDITDNPKYRLASSALIIVGVVAIYAENRFFNIDLTKAHPMLSSAFMEGGNNCDDGRLPPDIVNAGAFACGSQQSMDGIDAATQFGKVLHLSAGPSLLDGVLSSTAESVPDSCVALYRKAKPLCPSAFLQAEHDFPELLQSPN